MHDLAERSRPTIGTLDFAKTDADGRNVEQEIVEPRTSPPRIAALKRCFAAAPFAQGACACCRARRAGSARSA